MLLLSVFSIALGSGTSGQSVTTITSTETYTTVLASTSIAYYTLGTSYVTSTLKGSLYSGVFSIEPPSANYGCIYDNLPFTVKKNDKVSVSTTSSTAISFYIMSEDSFKKWLTQRLCAVKVDTYVKKEGIISYSADFVAPTDGQYEFLFVNDASSTANISFDAGTSAAVTTEASTIISYAAQTYVVTSTGSTVQSHTEAVTQSQGFSLEGNSLLILAVVAVLIIVGVAVMFGMRGRKTTGPKAVTQVQPPTPAPTAPMFCAKCRSAIPRDSKFCQECGTPVAA